MTIPLEIRRLVRERAVHCCEFCGVSEVDTGGTLTIDHFQPASKGGSDQLDNLLYSCMPCNLYKQNYWPRKQEDIPLWNPRLEPASNHFLLLDDGNLHPLTPVGTFTINRLRLNRSQLVQYRARKQKQAENLRLLHEYQSLTLLLQQVNQQYLTLIDEQANLLDLQRKLLTLLTQRRD
jgi:hypothetical protein